LTKNGLGYILGRFFSKAHLVTLFAKCIAAGAYPQFHLILFHAAFKCMRAGLPDGIFSNQNIPI
jgi:hypothetical protein